MNSRERVRLAMSHRQPDRVPVMCQLAIGHYFLHGDARPADIWFDSDTLIDALIAFQRRYRFDGLLVNVPGRPPDWKKYLAESREGENATTLTWQSGVVTHFVPDDNPHVFDIRGQLLARADYTTVDVAHPGTYRTEGYVWNTWHAPHLWDVPVDADLTDPNAYPSWFVRGLRRAREACPDVSVHAEVFSPFTHLMEMFGYETALIALIDAPDTCHRLLAVFTGIVRAHVQCYGTCGPDAMLVSSAFAGAGFLSREMYRDFVLPYERQVADAIHRFNIPAYTHTCGAIGDRLDLMAETGIDGIDTLDPPPLGTVDLASAKAEFGERLFFKGNLDAVHEMLHGDDETFHRAVMNRLEIGMPGSGYILSSACSVSPHVRPDRLEMLTPLAEEFGRYTG